MVGPLLLGGALTASVAVGVLPAQATTWTVSDCSGSPTDTGSLPYAVANAASGDTVTFAGALSCPPASPITLSSSMSIGVSSLTITGPGATTIAISGGYNPVGPTGVQAFHVLSGATATISGLTIEDGYDFSTTGGIYNEGTLHLSDSVFNDDSAGPYDCADIDNFSSMTITDSTFENDQDQPNSDVCDNDPPVYTGYGGSVASAAITGSTFTNNFPYGPVVASYYDSAMTISGSTFSGNGSDFGAGGVGVGGQTYPNTLDVTGSTFSGNTGGGQGGAIYVSGGTATVTGSTFSDNVDGYGGGGAIDNGDGASGTLSVSGSTFSGNSATSDGGAIDTGDDGGTGTTTVTDSTFSGNSAADNGGAIDNGDNTGSGTTTVTSSTFSGNAGASGGTIANESGAVDVGASILANASGALECAGTVTDEGYNIDDDGSCGLSNTGSVSGSATIDGTLGALADNGGSTQTILPASDSPVVGAVPNPTTLDSVQVCPTTDQRGEASPTGANCDIGAVETGQVNPTTPTISNLPGSGAYGGGFTASVSTDGDGATSVTSSTTPVCTTSGLTISYVGVGTCTLTAHVAAGPTYNPATGSPQSFTVNRATPTVSITNLPGSDTYGNGFTASVSTDGDGTSTSVTSSTPGVCRASGLTISYDGVGTCTLTAHVAVGTDYAAADGSGQSFAVDTDSTSTGLTSNAAGQSYGHEGATAFTVTVQTGNGEVLPTTDSATVHVGTASCVATLTPGGNGGGGHCSVGNNALTAGSYTASVTYGGDADLSGSGPATTPFTVTPAVDGVTFGGDPANPTVTVSGSGFGANSSAIGPPTGASCSASGSDYGTKFNFADNTNVWGAGTGPGDCIGVVISSYSNNQIVFTFGNGYDLYGGPINDGDTYSMTVLGTTFNGSASLGTGYTCTVSSLSGTTSFPVMVSESPAPPSSIDVGGTFSTALAAQVTVPASVIDHFIGLGATSLTVSSQTTSEDGLTAVGGSASGAVSPNTESASAFNLPLSDTTLVANTPYTYDTTYNPVTWQTGPGTGNVSFVPGTISAEATFVVSGTPTTESISCTPPSGVAALGSTTVDPPPPSPVFQVPSLSPPLQNTVSGGASGGSVATMAKVSKASVNGLAGSAGNDGGWAVTIANTSLASVTGLSASVSVSDGGAPLTYDLAAMAASGTNCANAGSGQLTCSIGTLAAGATSTLDVLVETTDLANGTGITGSVSVNSSNAGSQQTTLGPIGVVVIESGNGTAAVAAPGFLWPVPTGL